MQTHKHTDSVGLAAFELHVEMTETFYSDFQSCPISIFFLITVIDGRLKGHLYLTIHLKTKCFRLLKKGIGTNKIQLPQDKNALGYMPFNDPLI